MIRSLIHKISPRYVNISVCFEDELTSTSLGERTIFHESLFITVPKLVQTHVLSFREILLYDSLGTVQDRLRVQMGNSFDLFIEFIYASEQLSSLIVDSLGPVSPETSKVAKFGAYSDMLIERAVPLSASRRHVDMRLRFGKSASLLQVTR